MGGKGLVPLSAEMAGFLSRNSLSSAIFNFPTLFWINSSDQFLRAVALMGAVVSFLIFISVEWFVLDILLWVIYGSFLQVLAVFTEINDFVVMEVVFLFIFFFPWSWKPTFRRDKKPLRVAVLGFYFFLLKMTLGMLLFKLLGGSEYWKNLTFLKYFYPNSPLPTPLSYFIYQMPMWFHKFCTLMVFVFQIVTCLVVFSPPKYRRVAFYSIVLLQLPILLFTNLGATNLITILISFLLLLDLDQLQKIPWKKNFYAWVFIVLSFFSTTLLLPHFSGEANHLFGSYLFYKTPEKTSSFIEKAEIYLFRYKVQTILARFFHIFEDQRDIAFAYSSDGVQYQEYSLNYALSDEKTAPPFYWTLSFPRMRIPHFYHLKGLRLASARSTFYAHYPWFKALLMKAYKETDEFGENYLTKKVSCPGECRYFKLRLYSYHFSDLSELSEEGKWWNKNLISESVAIDLKNPPDDLPANFINFHLGDAVKLQRVSQ